MDQYGVIGNPIKHSLSPLIHFLFAQQTEQAMSYEPLLIPLDGLPCALMEFQAAGGKGINITMPFKHRAFTLVSSQSERAQLAEAINTVKFNEDGSMFGDNTDGFGLIQDIAYNNAITLMGKRILVLGAGGAVRGILGSLLSEGPLELIIANRTESKAALLADQFDSRGPISACSMRKLSNYKFDVVINGTSASLKEETIELPDDILLPDAYCYDMVYGKGETPFLTWAKHQHAQTSDGLGMLVEQAAESFYLWRGVKPDTQSVLDRLKNSKMLTKL